MRTSYRNTSPSTSNVRSKAVTSLAVDVFPTNFDETPIVFPSTLPSWTSTIPVGWTITISMRPSSSGLK